jgi:CheY-like chemotaxis protein
MLILYVEDDLTHARLVERYIKMTQHQVRIATNINDAMTEMESLPGLVMVDLLLGASRDGYNFVRELRDQGYDQPIVAVTGLTMPTEIERCYEVGVNEILAKPYTIDQLADIINRYTS